MSVVEGMSAGNIPVLLNQGGLREIVHTDSGSEPFGHLCDTLDDFVRHTIDVFELPTERKRVLQQAARARAERYSDKSFTHAFQARIAFRITIRHLSQQIFITDNQVARRLRFTQTR